MIEGLIRHDTQMRVEKNFVDSHGQSEVAKAKVVCSMTSNSYPGSSVSNTKSFICQIGGWLTNFQTSPEF